MLLPRTFTQFLGQWVWDRAFVFLEAPQMMFLGSLSREPLPQTCGPQMREEVAIRFKVKNAFATKIHHQLVEVYKENLFSLGASREEVEYGVWGRRQSWVVLPEAAGTPNNLTFYMAGLGNHLSHPCEHPNLLGGHGEKLKIELKSRLH